MVVIAQELLARRYEASPCSLGALFHFSCYIALIILPFVTAYSSHSLWLTEKTGREQPEVHFQHEVLVIAQGELPSQQFMFSTSPALNALFGDSLRAASLRLRESDTNNDGRPEMLHVEVSLPLKPGEAVVGVTVLIGVQYSLQDTARWSTNATAIVQHMPGIAGSALQYWGEFELRSSTPLQPDSLGSTTGPPVLVGAGRQTTTAALQPAALISRYMAYPDTVHVNSRYPTWIPGGGGSRFTAEITLVARPELVRYKPQISEILKGGWIQYISFFIPLWFLLRQLKWFAAVNQITPCRVAVDRPQIRKINDHDF